MMATEASLWAFSYQVIPPQAEHRMKQIRAILDEEQRQAKRDARCWTARFVDERQVEHLLIVSDSPRMDREVNHRLEAELREMGLEFSVTTPMPVDV
jgi:hypothetical protein